MNQYRTFTVIMTVSVFLSACAPASLTTQAPEADADADADADTDRVVMPSVGKTPASTPLLDTKPMTFQTLSVCATKISHLKKEATQFKAEGVQFAKRKIDIDLKNQTLNVERAAINTKQSKQVEAFNRRLKQAQFDTKQFNSSVHAFNTRLSRLHSRSDAVNTSCAQRTFKHADILRLPPNLRMAIESSSETMDIPLLEENAATQQ
ncbi:MAG: hypothetical protein NTV00_01860 [Methylococcales bacterium]|nr:hypothetical protein [Methylococcales bacterium]